MGLANFAQIKGGKALVADVAALKASYEALKVLTHNVKTAAQGEEGDPDYVAAVNYNAQELFDKILDDIAAIQGGAGGVSLESLKAATDLLDAQLNGGTVEVDGEEQTIEGLKNKEINDVVRLVLSRTSGTVTVEDDQVEHLDNTNTALPVYGTDNKPLYDTDGNQLTFNLTTKEFSGTPAELDVTASKNATDGNLRYKAIEGDFSFKVFPVGTWTLETLPGNALLDNQEMQIIAYEQAIQKIVVDLAKDADLIDAIRTAVGPQAIDDAVADATKVIDTRLKVLEKADTTGAIRFNNLKGTAAVEQVGEEGEEGYVAPVAAETINDNTKVYTVNAIDEIVDTIDEDIDAIDGRLTTVENKYVDKTTLVNEVKASVTKKVAKEGQTLDLADPTTYDEVKDTDDQNTINETTLVAKFAAVDAAIATNANNITNLGSNADETFVKRADLVQAVKAHVNKTATQEDVEAGLAEAVGDTIKLTDDTKALSETAVVAKFEADDATIKALDEKTYDWANIQGTAAKAAVGEEGDPDYVAPVDAETITESTKVYSAALTQEKLDTLEAKEDAAIAALDAKTYDWSKIVGTPAVEGVGELGDDDYVAPVAAEPISELTNVYSAARVDADIAAAKKEITDSLNGKDAAMDERVSAIEAIKNKTEKVTVEATTVEEVLTEKLTLSETPTADGVTIIINGVVYDEIEGDFTREGKVVTWDATAAGFSLSEVLDPGEKPTVQYQYISE